MIGKIIALRQDIHSADHGLTARIDYVAAKATYMDTPCIPGCIDAAAAQMAATCRRHRRDPRTAHVHMVLSWPAGEDPSDDQARAAAKHAMARLGAEGHEAVIAVHRDTDHIHVHTIYSRVHPITGQLADQWQDYARVELACREIEAVQGWTPDNGRFRVEIDDTGPVPAVRLLRQSPDHWERKRAIRRVHADLRQADIDQARSGGHMPLHLRLPIAVLTKIRQDVEQAATWSEVLVSLGRFGLGYRTTRRGTVIHLRGGADAVAVSRMLPGVSHARLVARLGPLPDPGLSAVPMPPGATVLTIRGYGRGASARIGQGRVGARAQVAALHASLLDDPQLRDRIADIDLSAPRRIVVMRDGGWVADRGAVIRIGGTGAIRPRIDIALRMIAARVWRTLDIPDDTPIARALMRAAADRGIATLMPPDPTGALLRVRLGQAAQGSEAPILPQTISAALTARAGAMHSNDLRRAARGKTRDMILSKAQGTCNRLEDDLADLPPAIRKPLIRITQTAYGELAIAQTDLRRGLSRSAPLDLLDAAREITPERMTLESAQDLHHRLRAAATIDPQARRKVYGNLIYPRPDLCLLAHRDQTGEICGYEFAAFRGQEMRAGLIPGSRPTFGLLPAPGKVARYDTAASLMEALAMLPEALRTGTQLASLGGNAGSPEARRMVETHGLMRAPPDNDLPRAPDG